MAKGLRRVVKKELRSAIDQLERPSEESIHEARKSIKKVRAVVQFADRAVGGVGRDIKRLRGSGRLLSPLRDADAMVSSANDLCRQTGAALHQHCVGLREMLKRHKDRLLRRAERDKAAQRAKAALERTRRSAKDWRLEKMGFSDLADEIKRAYKKARRQMDVARNRARASDFHEWRKQTKALWYGFRLLERRLPALRARVNELHELETWLGEDHNLLMLRTHAVGDRMRGGRRETGKEVRALAKRRQQELRRESLAAGARVFREKPKALRRDLQKMWRERRRRQGQRRRTDHRVRTADNRRSSHRRAA